MEIAYLPGLRTGFIVPAELPLFMPDSQIRTEEDVNGRTIRIFDGDNKVYELHYHCSNCGWNGQIDQEGPGLQHCPNCNEGRHFGGLSEEVYEDGAWMDAFDPDEHEIDINL